MPLNPDFKAQWVAALRSGEYPQARGMLFDGTGYCCLGVACKILGATFVKDGLGWLPKFNGDEVPKPNQFLLPTTIAKDVGLSGGMQTTLAKMNDKDGKDFNQIADFIESNY